MHCAGEGKPATLVLTDIEGSTELWEWDAGSMMLAVSLHDRILRSQLSRFNGFEVSTEGDAFLMVFHEPADAIGWALATQQVSFVCGKIAMRITASKGTMVC